MGRHRAAVKATPRRLIRQGKGPKAPRRDLELETLLQILESERFVTCHSYRQDEINMLMHVADSMGFTLNTFTHILEGYKVADKMAEHGAGGSSFSDWWAYKFEVKDAIPYNGALLWENGVVTAFNSDDREMARRLNQEAAKAVKYGGVPEEEALKFVTLNPAILLHLDDRIGFLEAGKDADLVVVGPPAVHLCPMRADLRRWPSALRSGGGPRHAGGHAFRAGAAHPAYARCAGRRQTATDGADPAPLPL